MALGSLLGAVHVFWALLVGLGWAQPVVDFIHSVHFMKSTEMVGAFNLGTALLLVIVASLIGYTLGWLFGYFWNRIQK